MASYKLSPFRGEQPRCFATRRLPRRDFPAHAPDLYRALAPAGAAQGKLLTTLIYPRCPGRDKSSVEGGGAGALSAARENVETRVWVARRETGVGFDEPA